MEYKTLNNGVRMPMLGFGTMNQFGFDVMENVSHALNNGYQLIDTANRYDNEVDVGEGIKQSGISRENIFLETKLGPTLYEDKQAIDDTLKRLQVEYIDLMLLHHPVNNYIHAYKMLEKAYQEGKIKAIGISNFPIEKLQELLDTCDVVPTVMQVECHPYYPAEGVKSFCDEHGIALQSWYPLGHGNTDLLKEPVIVDLANKYHKSTVQIILRWHMQMGFGAVPGSTSWEHMESNADIFDFTLTKEDMAEIASINKHIPFYQITKESLERLATTKCNFEK
jgi:diketogulonate reductase-like aldo/keto reductase